MCEDIRLGLHKKLVLRNIIPNFLPVYHFDKGCFLAKKLPLDKGMQGVNGEKAGGKPKNRNFFKKGY